MRGYPQLSFWISITLVKIDISCIIINRGKNPFELVGAVKALLSPWRLNVMSVRGPNNVGRAVRTDAKLLRYASAITEQKKSWDLLVGSNV